ncbi:hypothetical protein FRC08_008843 [Ceratobasidium sp. 394]|nr:hypothetical protein FRC08_008843 [Ceratobasidium sp. 394]
MIGIKGRGGKAMETHSNLTSSYSYSYLQSHYSTTYPLAGMSFFTKSRSSRGAASSSTSLLLPSRQEKCSSLAQKDYTAAFGALASQYGASGYSPAQASPARGIPAESSSVSSSVPRSSKSNARPVRAKDFGALQNKYGAVGYGGMTSII